MKARRDAAQEPGTISVQRLTKYYGTWAALTGVTFSLEPGQALGLWGPNGAGKTTIVRCLLGLARYEGEIRVGGLDPARKGREVRKLIGYVPQDLPVSPVTVAEMAAFISTLKGASLADAQGQLERLGIDGHQTKAVGALSGGLRQRLAVALALIGSPSVLLLDEPTANLDARGRAELLDLLLGFKRDGMTILFSSHRSDDVLKLADQILMIEAGAIQTVATPAEFQRVLSAGDRMVITLRNGHLPEALELLRSMGVEASGSGHVLAVDVGSQRKPELFTALTRHGVDLVDFEVERGRWNGES